MAKKLESSDHVIGDTLPTGTLISQGSYTTAAELADLLAATARDEWYDAHCPAHDDERPSLQATSLAEGRSAYRVKCL
jgi:hypothetical protein